MDKRRGGVRQGSTVTAAGKSSASQVEARRLYFRAQFEALRNKMGPSKVVPADGAAKSSRGGQVAPLPADVAQVGH